MEIILAAVGTAACLFLVLVKLNLRRCLGYDAAIDIGFTVFMMWLFAGTFSGAFAAVLAGTALSLILMAAKWLIGYERFDVKRRAWVRHPAPAKKHLDTLHALIA